MAFILHTHTHKARSNPAQLSANFINLNVQFMKPNRLDGRSSLIESAQQLTKEQISKISCWLSLSISIIVVGKPVAWGNFCLLIGIEK
jgi:hypothetical protein